VQQILKTAYNTCFSTIHAQIIPQGKTTGHHQCPRISNALANASLLPCVLYTKFIFWCCSSMPWMQNPPSMHALHRFTFKAKTHGRDIGAPSSNLCDLNTFRKVTEKVTICWGETHLLRHILTIGGWLNIDSQLLSIWQHCRLCIAVDYAFGLGFAYLFKCHLQVHEMSLWNGLTCTCITLFCCRTGPVCLSFKHRTASSLHTCGKIMKSCNYCMSVHFLVSEICYDMSRKFLNLTNYLPYSKN